MSESTISTFELFQMFPDAEAARVYMEGKRWPDYGAICPACSLRDTARVRHEVGTVAYTFFDQSVPPIRFRFHEHLGEHLYEMGLIDMDVACPPPP